MAAWLRVRGDSILMDIKAQGGASKTESGGLKDGRLKVRIAAAPEDGKANAELRRFIAAALNCAKGEVKLIAGEKSRLKTVEAPLSRRAQAEALALRSKDL
ncbi:MAG: DUF167 domain-containing protein [Treponema sp.]|jgi:uncharacterized protein (TIGR00251 family)|nr:DUF167 domain-containing protein [Treponema sp.]